MFPGGQNCPQLRTTALESWLTWFSLTSHINLLASPIGSASEHTENTSIPHTSTAPALIQAAIIQILDDSKGILICLFASTVVHFYSQHTSQTDTIKLL